MKNSLAAIDDNNNQIIEPINFKNKQNENNILDDALNGLNGHNNQAFGNVGLGTDRSDGLFEAQRSRSGYEVFEKDKSEQIDGNLDRIEPE